jgi:rod shape-determining protein MreC
MYDKQVRRRRAVLFALVVCCLVLLTAYFGESSGGPLRSVQTGAMEVVAPVQEGANRALKPFRDLFGWFGDTWDAKDERDKLEAERDQLRQEVARLKLMENENAELRDLVDYARGSGLDAYDPVTARVYSRSNSSWYSTIEINKGSSDGVQVNQPVINGKGLVGKVKTVSDGNAVVMLLSDSEFGAAALAVEADQPGSILPVTGSPGDLLLDLVPSAKEVRRGDRIVTAGTVSDRLPSPFPEGILIGTVKRIDGEGELDRTIHVEPAADLRSLDFVQLTTVSQIAVFGVPADLSPLLVAAVGLLCGSIAGASFGFGIGLFMDTLLAQTLGLSSLVLVGTGYAAGRLRELRDPAHALIPVAVGAAATAVAAVGFTILQLLLGVDAPVSVMLIRQILLVIVLNTLIAMPVYLACRRVLAPFLPDDPRRRRRRAYTTGGLSPLSRA